MSGLVAVVPFSPDYAGGRLFELGGPLDRDNSLVPWAKLAAALAARGLQAVTHDLLDGREPLAWLHLDSHGPPPAAAPPGRTVLVLIEPEVVAPYWYRRFDREAAVWGGVVTHRRDLVRRGPPFHYLRFPQALTRRAIHKPRDLPLVMINARKYPAVRKHSLYGARERVAAWFARRDAIQVFGPGWGQLDRRHPISSWRNLALRTAARGVVERKAAILDRAEFVLCFENMVSAGYHTEKLFDALAAGAIPLYWGDPEITGVVPASAFVDYTSLRTPRRARAALANLTGEERDQMRAIGQEFLGSEAFRPYLPDAFADDIAGIIESVVA